MDIIILNNSDVPIYEQIEKQIKVMIFSGELKQGNALPSMRMLAKELKISIITTKRAYEDLERDGFIESFTGRGSFVKKINKESVREQALFEIEGLYDSILEKAESADITYEELEEIFSVLKTARNEEGMGKSC